MGKTILIIGAGAAGLMAAKTLCEMGYSVSIHEASGRIGGRIYTLLDGFTQEVEGGAEFIHGNQPRTFALLKEASIEVIPMKGNWYQVKKGAIAEGAFGAGHWVTMMDRLFSLRQDTAFGDFLASNFAGEEFTDFRDSMRGFVEGYDAADLSRVSSFALREEWSQADDEQQFRVRGGYMALLNYLAKAITEHNGQLYLSSEATEIHWSKEAVTVITKDKKEFKGDAVLVTIPIGILQRGCISFSPSLPYPNNIFDAFGFGGVIKILIEFDRNFWETRMKLFPEAAFILSDATVPTWWTQSPLDVPILTGWLAGPSSLKYGDDKDIYTKALQSLTYIFKSTLSETEESIKKWACFNWPRAPFALGAYTYPTLESGQARDLLSKSADGLIFFAGEAFYKGPAMGTVEAALVSGEEAAKSVHDWLKLGG